jgi:hypothetical protein
MTTLHTLTVEHLGPAATDTDLHEFRLTIDRILPAFGYDEESAIDWLWGDGDYQPRINAAACAYCGALVLNGIEVPASDDDAAWAKLATEHAAGCEWIVTRAHRLEV